MPISSAGLMQKPSSSLSYKTLCTALAEKQNIKYSIVMNRDPDTRLTTKGSLLT